MQIETSCPYCGVGCGITVELDAQRRFKSLKGSEDHPANFGRLCSKGSALGETLDATYLPNRIRKARVNGKELSQQDAIQTVATKLKSALDNYGPDSVAFYLSGQLLTEDYYVANKFAKGFLGTANVDTNSRLCMSSAVAGYKRAFGGDIVPCDYEDLEQAQLIVLIGSNTAWTHPVVYQRIVVAKERNPSLKIVVIDPRQTVTSDIADLYLPIKPSSDAYLFHGLLHYLISEDVVDQEYVNRHTEGFDKAVAACADFNLVTVSEKTEVSIDLLTQFYCLFAQTEKTVSFYSQGINQSASGTAKCNAIINCHLATGRIGHKGAGPFSITGQPNAMGGREVGGLANMLAAHLDFEESHLSLVEEFWQAPNMISKPGLKAIDLFDAVHEEKIKFLWIMGTNPAVSLPNTQYVNEALSKCETVVVSDVVDTSTTRHASIVLPALPWSEKDGTVTNSERRISRQRQFLPKEGASQQDWWWMSKVAQSLGFEQQFNYKTVHEVFLEHAKLSCFNNEGDTERAFNIEALKDLTVSEYQQLEPVQWPAKKTNKSAAILSDGYFYTKSNKAQFIVDEARLAKATSSDLVLMTGRYRDQWHTMTRTAYAPSLQGHDSEPRLEVSLEDAQKRQIRDGQFVKITSATKGSLILRIRVSNDLKAGRCFAPMHWNDMFSAQAQINDLVPAEVDPISGQPESKAIGVQLEKHATVSCGTLISTSRLKTLPEFDYFADMPLGKYWLTCYASEQEIDIELIKRCLLTAAAELDSELKRELKRELKSELNKELHSDEPILLNLNKVKTTSFSNPAKQQSNSIYYINEQLFAAASFAERGQHLPSSHWLAQEFEKLDAASESQLLAGEQGESDELVCACFSTGSKSIREVIEQEGNNLPAISGALGCGSKCGSCIPELKRLIQQS